MSQTRRPPKRFAPLDPHKGNASKAPPLKGIVFDVDGTLWYVCFIDCDDAFVFEMLMHVGSLGGESRGFRFVFATAFAFFWSQISYVKCFLA